jgi:hypothetical protein
MNESKVDSFKNKIDSINIKPVSRKDKRALNIELD